MKCMGKTYHAEIGVRHRSKLYWFWCLRYLAMSPAARTIVAGWCFRFWSDFLCTWGLLAFKILLKFTRALQWEIWGIVTFWNIQELEERCTVWNLLWRTKLWPSQRCSIESILHGFMGLSLFRKHVWEQLHITWKELTFDPAVFWDRWRTIKVWCCRMIFLDKFD